MWIVFIGGLEQEKISSLSHELKNPPIVTNLNSNCRLQDSLVLVDIYNAANGPGWTTPWNLNNTMDNWDGIVLNSSGCLDELRLSNRNLVGTVAPTIGNLSEITLLHLDNNNLQGQIPGSIGNLTALKTLFLDNNNFTGVVPIELGYITSLNTLFIDNNNLTGEIPISFLGLNNLTNLEFFGNKIDSVPDLSSIMTLIIQNNKLKMTDNALTFDDIIPNMSSSLGIHYAPQDSVFQEVTYFLSTGDPFIIDLEIDEGLTTSSYRWYKDGSFYAGPFNSSKFPIGPVSFSDAGVYHCQITNPNAGLLTLYSRPITIQVSCGISYGNLEGDYCADQDFWVNGNLYNQSNPTGSEYMPFPDQYGCDSVLNINLQFLNNATSNFQRQICNNESFLINGVTYDINNPTGTETLSDAAYNGCDSIVTINLTTAPPSEKYIDDIICSTASIFVNGTSYNFNNPIGTETLANQNYLGCDSIVYINLTFHPLAEGSYNQELCAGGSYTVGSVLFDESNTAGSVLLPNQNYLGCDSMVTVSLTFSDAISAEYAPTLCLGEFRVINGVTYDSNNPTGSELFPQGSYIGCDSIVNIDLSYHGFSQGFINETLCEDESVTVGDITFDFINRSGAVVLYDQSYYGCDSTVFVNLSFTIQQEVYLNELLCSGDFRQINGVTYDVNNPTGTTTLPAQQFEDCDSLLHINLTYLPLAEGFINENKCEGEEVSVNGITFDINNPTGAVSFIGQGFNGCDSTVYVNLVYKEASEAFVNELLCIGDTRVINGVTYDANNPTGAEYFSNQNYFGCDSTVFVNLVFMPPAENFINNTLCNGTTMLINGVTYDETNATGTEMLPAMGYNGCDSTIYVNLTFTDMVVNDMSETLCTGSSILVNGVTYNESNPIGTETFPMGSYIGCDSIVEVNLSFYSSPIKYLNPILCEGDFIEVNGVTYDQNNLFGIETLTGQAFLACDSIVDIAITYYESTPTELNPTICVNHFYELAGVIYDTSNPTGTVILDGQSYNGCDSVVAISLNFHESEIGTFNPSTCTNGTIEFNGTTYDMSNPSGTEILVNQSFYGCDSTVNVQVEFVQSIEETRDEQLCMGASITVNETIYDIDNPTGIEQMTSVNGCDSIVTISLTFNNGNSSSYDLTENICPNEEIIVNNVSYNASNLLGTEILLNASYLGCDSTVNIELNLLSASNTFYNQTLCVGQVVELHGQTFDVNNPFGIIELDTPNSFGCDSSLIVELTFNPLSTLVLEQTLCEAETLDVNGVTYDITNPTGTEVINGGNYLGCDSIIQINLLFSPPSIGTFEQQLCTGENVVINGTTYDATNLSGTEILENANYLGCDSLVEVSIQFVDAVTSSINQVICDGDSFLFDGQNISASGSYNQTIVNGSIMGCDSIVTLILSVEDPTQLGLANAGIDEILCDNEVTLNANLPTGTIGNWDTTADIAIANPASETILLENIPPGTHELTWTLVSPLCGVYSSDMIQISVADIPIANEDTYDIIGDDGSENLLEITSNDIMETAQNTTINILSSPDSGEAIMSDNSTLEYIPDPEFNGIVEIEYEICDEFCPDNCSTSFITINVSQAQETEEIPNVPNAITANEDGINDEWIIDILAQNPTSYENSKLVIINRWGAPVFEASPYLNNWDGTDKNGLPLPTGTYYYNLQLDLSNGVIYKGDVTILR